MKTLLGVLFSFMLILPNAWAESATEPVEKLEIEKQKLVIIDTEKNEDKTSRDKKIDSVFDLISKEIETEAGSELTKEELATIKSGLKEAKDALKEIDDVNIRIGSDSDSIMEMFVGMIAIILIFGGPIIIVAIALYSSFKKRRLTHETINSYVAAGKDIPAEVLKGLQKQSDPKSSLHKGVVLIGIGLGIFLCFALIGSIEAGAFGLIPLFIGLAQLLVWKFENNKNGLDN